jgi:TonB family protein
VSAAARVVEFRRPGDDDCSMKRSHPFLFAAALALLARPVSATEPTAEVLLGTAGPAGDYLQTLHGNGSKRWERGFLTTATGKLAKDHPLNNPSLRVTLELSLDRNGKLVTAKVKEPSGLTEFDQAALEVAKDSTPLGPAPELALSDDNRAHFLWSFARDERRCDEVRLVQVESPLDEALPRLLASSRDGEGLRRVHAARVPEAAMSLFATVWLKQALARKEIAPAAAVALVAGGGQAEEGLLRTAVQQGVGGAALPAALARAKVPVCGQVRDWLATAGSREQAAAVAVLRQSGEGACVPGLIAVAEDKAQPVALRVAAVQALGAGADPSARKVLRDLAKDGAPAALRAAAIVATSPAGGGNAALFRLAPLLHDPSVEVRTAVITGLLHAVGEPSLTQFYLLFNEKDPRPYEAAAAGLAHLTSEASAALLARMLHKDDVRIRRAAAAALAMRSDGFARKALEAVRGDQNPDVRVFASALLEDSQRRELVAGLTASTADFGPLYHALVGGSARVAAVDWLATTFVKAEPAAKVDLLGAWLVGYPAPASIAVTPPEKDDTQP